MNPELERLIDFALADGIQIKTRRCRILEV